MQQLANDIAGLMDALKIQKVDVLGLSLGSYIAQQLTITYPEKVNRLILVGSSCGGGLVSILCHWSLHSIEKQRPRIKFFRLYCFLVFQSFLFHHLFVETH